MSQLTKKEYYAIECAQKLSNMSDARAEHFVTNQMEDLKLAFELLKRNTIQTLKTLELYICLCERLKISSADSMLNIKNIELLNVADELNFYARFKKISIINLISKNIPMVISGGAALHALDNASSKFDTDIDIWFNSPRDIKQYIAEIGKGRKYTLAVPVNKPKYINMTLKADKFLPKDVNLQLINYCTIERIPYDFDFELVKVRYTSDGVTVSPYTLRSIVTRKMSLSEINKFHLERISNNKSWRDAWVTRNFLENRLLKYVDRGYEIVNSESLEYSKLLNSLFMKLTILKQMIKPIPPTELTELAVEDLSKFEMFVLDPDSLHSNYDENENDVKSTDVEEIVQNFKSVVEPSETEDFKSVTEPSETEEFENVIMVTKTPKNDIPLQDQTGKKNKVLEIAITNKFYAIVKELLDDGADPNIIISTPEAEIFAIDYAIQTADDKLILLLMSKGVNIQTDYKGDTLLHKLCRAKPTYDILLLLCNLNIDINQQTYYNQNTALHDLCNNDNIQLGLVRCLIKSGAEIHIKNAQGMTPYDVFLARAAPNDLKHKVILEVLKPNSLESIIVVPNNDPTKAQQVRTQIEFLQKQVQELTNKLNSL